ncbi:MAG: cyclic 2,3-diphosphoglycerate synthase [Methanotrichaceae archaeon]|nr:cyclic 2,3-diphosphoglycerate synthase [Methanotrichaceae archaeon]
MDYEDKNRERILILGAAGRDFHNFNVFFRDKSKFEVVGFTAAQIPDIDCRTYPPELSGRLYPAGLPIWQENCLEDIIGDHNIDRCILAYSDLSNQDVMDLASRVMAMGADFGFLGGWHTMIESEKPVIAVCAVRTGAGKSQVVRYIVNLIREAGLKTVVVRHPMPYGNLVEQAIQRFSSQSELSDAKLTIEEREEYEAHIKRDTVVYAGIDYEAILRLAEIESDVIVWDGGNNDTPFFKPDLWITVADALRPGHEISYYPGETNFRAANIIVINKANSAPEKDVRSIEANGANLNPKASVIVAGSEVTADNPEVIRSKRVLVIEDGPTITHGGMAYGAGKVAADKYEAAEIVDPRPFAVGSIKDIFSKFGHIGKVLPAMGYYPEQVRALEKTINNTQCDSVVIATPVDLRRLIKISRPSTTVFYDLVDMNRPFLRDKIGEFISYLWRNNGTNKSGREKYVA